MKKRVLITTGVFPPDIGGPASYCLTLAKKLSEDRSVTVVAYSSVRRHHDDNNLPFKLKRVWKRIPKGLRHLVFFLRVLKAARQADIVLSLNAVSAGVPALWAAKMCRKPFVVKIVGDYSWEIAVNKGMTSLLLSDFQNSPRPGRPGRLHRLQTWVCKNASLVIVPSQFLADMVAGWGIDQNKIIVIYNGVDFEPSVLSKEEARKEIGISGNILISIGRLVSWKGFRMLIKIMPQLFSINQFFRLIIVGDGPDRHALEMMVKNLGLERKVYIVGAKSRKELAVYLAAADMFLLNTGYEGFSHQILEAMTAGVPVITTTAGGNGEIVHQGENGFMVRYNDEFNLIEAIKSLWQMPGLRQEFIDKGKETAAYFNVEKMLKETITALDLKK